MVVLLTYHLYFDYFHHLNLLEYPIYTFHHHLLHSCLYSSSNLDYHLPFPLPLLPISSFPPFLASFFVPFSFVSSSWHKMPYPHSFHPFPIILVPAQWQHHSYYLISSLP